MSKSKKIISVFCLFTTLCLVIGMVGCNKPQSKSDILKYVKDNVPEEASLVDYKENQTSVDTEYVYTFKSDSRDLKFYIISTRGTSSLGGYYITDGYITSIREYYKDEMKYLLTSCPNSEMYINPGNKYAPMKFYIDTDSDAKAVAKVAAKCNEIVAEQWEYQPGADLTKFDVLGLYFDIYSSDSNKMLGSYYLNGKDDEDVIYNKLKGMLP